MYWVNPLSYRYLETAWEPGDKDVLIYGRILIPLSWAFLHNNAELSITPGFDVFVHEVIAAITTDPWLSSKV